MPPTFFTPALAALLKAKLEPYLGFLHSVQFGKPSLVCELQELYRYIVDDYIIQFCQGLGKKDFTTKTEEASKNRKGRREYLKDDITNKMMKGLQAVKLERLDAQLFII